MSKVKSCVSVTAAIAAGLLLATAAGAADGGSAAIRRVDTLHVPGAPLASFDIGFVNSEGVYALADRSNAGVDLIEAADGKFLGRVTGFKGFSKAAGSGASGPDGVVAVGSSQFWAGDGDSTVKIVDIKSRSIVDTISTGGKKRVDEMAYDPRDHLVVVVNNADEPPFVTFISTQSHRVVGKIVLDHASDGAEQPAWDAATGRIYLTIPVIDKVDANGAVAVIDPRTRKLEKLMPVDKCMPAGLAVGPRNHLLVACSDDAVAAGFPAKSLVMDASSGKILATIDHVGGTDEAWYDAESAHYYLAAAANTGGPVLGVIDAATDQWAGNLPSGPRAHSVAADSKTGRVFVPIEARKDGGDCSTGCIAVYAK